MEVTRELIVERQAGGAGQGEAKQLKMSLVVKVRRVISMAWYRET
jgi:hypothetical protein